MKTEGDRKYWLLGLSLLFAAAPLHAASTLQFSATSYAVTENAGSATLIVERTDDLGTAVSVDYGTADDTATAGSDFTKVTGTLQFAAGETRKTFAVTILNDGLVEATETFQVLLRNPSAGAVLGIRTTANVRITD